MNEYHKKDIILENESFFLMAKKIYIIANPDAGSFLNSIQKLEELLLKGNIIYDLAILNDATEIPKAVERASREGYDAFGVFGGDGTVVPVMKVLAGKKIPLLIIPAGTANIVAKAAGIPTNALHCLKALKEERYILRKTPVAETSMGPLALDMHFGIFSETIHETPSGLKKWLGQSAYHLTTLGKVQTAELSEYHLKIDGREIKETGFACFVVNMGNMPFLGTQILPTQRPDLLSVMIIKNKNIRHFYKWYVYRVMTGRHLPSAIRTWYGREVEVLEAPESFIFDDQQKDAKFPITVKSGEAAVNLLIPVTSPGSLSGIRELSRATFHRYTDRVRRNITGVPSDRFSRIAKDLYLGGQYGARAIKEFETRGITGIISMRTATPKPIENSHIELLQLPTKDWSPPTIESLKEGVAFIQKQSATGGAAYVHCRLGEGRGPSMAAAYLISQGMRTEDALAHLRRYRPFAKPNRRQVARLKEFEKHIRS